MEFSLQLKGFSNAVKNLQAGKSAVANATTKMLDMATLVAQAKAKEVVPTVSTTLRKSIARKVEKDVGRVGSNVEYAPYVEFGTGIYGKRGSPIVPKRAKMLSWIGGDGKRVFARSVRGMRPRKFLQTGLEEVTNRTNQIYKVGIEALRSAIFA